VIIGNIRLATFGTYVPDDSQEQMCVQAAVHTVKMMANPVLSRGTSRANRGEIDEKLPI
jgi:hypothetical protein